MTTLRRTLVLLALASTACAARYGAQPPLAFADIPYAGPSGEPWSVSYLELRDTAAAWGMAKAPRMAYVELNRGGPKGSMVFVHGLGSYLKFWWYQLDAFAKDGWHVVAVDLPGYGKSDKPASFPYTMEAMADAVRELARALGIARPVLVGHSMGGQTALSYAIRYPSEPRALVLTSPAGFETFTPREQAWFRQSFTMPLVTRAPEYAIWGSVSQNNFARWRDELEWLIEERVRMAKNDDFEEYAYAQVRSVQALAANDFVRQSLGQVQVPALIVFGEEDRLIPNPFLHGGRVRAVMESGHRGIPGSTLVELEGCGHASQLDCPSEYNDVVRAFLGGLAAAPSGS